MLGVGRARKQSIINEEHSRNMKAETFAPFWSSAIWLSETLRERHETVAGFIPNFLWSMK